MTFLAARCCVPIGSRITTARAKSSSRPRAALIRSDSVFGACYRRLKSRLGPSQALIATAHKLARVVYKMLKDKVPYEHTTAQAEDERFREREIAYLRRKAAKLGLILSEPEVSLVS